MPRDFDTLLVVYSNARLEAQRNERVLHEHISKTVTYKCEQSIPRSSLGGRRPADVGTQPAPQGIVLVGQGMSAK
jgi:hypothetical protein